MDGTGADVDDPLSWVRWSPRVRQDRIRRLYEQDAKGTLDEVLVDDVGLALYLRCRSILTVTEAADGCVRCPRCARERNVESLILCPEGQRRWRAHDAVTCPTCGWHVVWRAFHRTWRQKQLLGGGAIDAFEEFVVAYDRAETARDRLLAIDRVIHRFHWEMTARPTRPSGVNLIEGSERDVMAFLDRLTYGGSDNPEAAANKEQWRAVKARAEAIWGNMTAGSPDGPARSVEADEADPSV
jgi:hypothetical protein